MFRPRRARSGSALTSMIGSDQAVGSPTNCARLAGLLGKLQTQRLRFGNDLPQRTLEQRQNDRPVDLDIFADVVGGARRDRASGQTRCQAARSTTRARRRLARAPCRTPTLDRDRNSDQTRTERPCSQRPKGDAATPPRLLNRADLHGLPAAAPIDAMSRSRDGAAPLNRRSAVVPRPPVHLKVPTPAFQQKLVAGPAPHASHMNNNNNLRFKQ